MKILHVTSSMSPQWGGPSQVIADITNSLEKKGVTCSIIAAQGNRVGTSVVNVNASELLLFKTSRLSGLWTGYSRNIGSNLRELVSEHDIVHIHELWHFLHYAAFKAAIELDKPFCITTHGALSPWAITHKRIRKQIYMRLVQRSILEKAFYIHTITPDEGNHIRQLGISTPTFTIPNGIYPESINVNLQDPIMIRRYPELHGKQIILFLGRIHPIKGLDLLADALGILIKKHPNIYTIIAGPNEDNYQTNIENILKENGAADNVIFTGMLTGSDKLSALASASILVVPSHSEVMSIAALEGMASSLPIIITEECQFPEVSDCKAGIVIKRTSQDLVAAILKLITNPSEASAMGQNGYELVQKKFTWETLSEKYIEMYSNILRNE